MLGISSTLALVVLLGHISGTQALTLPEDLRHVTHTAPDRNSAFHRMKSADCSPLNPPQPAPSQFWLESIAHNGQSSFLTGATKSSYTVFRNVVKDFKADSTGNTDATAAIQSAITSGAAGTDRSSGTFGTTGQPAVVYIPSGTYLISKPIQLFVGTVVIGDPINPPVLKAASSFSGDMMVNGQDPKHASLVMFYAGMRNLIFDTTSIASAKKFTALDWTVSQATQINNLKFRMPYGSSHIGIGCQNTFYSNLIINDLVFEGGAYAINFPNGIQWAMKNITVRGTTTGIKAVGAHIIVQDSQFHNCTTAIDATGAQASMTVLDSAAVDVGTFILAADAKGISQNNLILENLKNDGKTLVVGSTTLITGSVTKQWVRGPTYMNGKTTYQTGQAFTNTRPPALLVDGKYFTMQQPSYKEYGLESFINIKSVQGLPVAGDGATDDTANINKILKENAGCKIIYFPAGTYIVSDIIFVPPSTRIVGDAFASTISATGKVFANAKAPIAMIKVGNAGDVGIAQMSDLLLTTADILPGCKLLEINMAGNKPGDVGLWNVHFRIGGGIGSKVQTGCGGTQDKCMAAWALPHLTSPSSAYLENMWGWTADHDLDGSRQQNIATGRGALIEATKGTWMIATAMEHHTLYHYNFNGAANVFTALQQTETPYWQGAAGKLAPYPWDSALIPSDPTFQNCGSSDTLCRMSWMEIIKDSRDLALYSASDSAFIFSSGTQTNAISVNNNNSRVSLYATNTLHFGNVFTEDGKAIVPQQKGAAGNFAMSSVAGYFV